MTGVLTKYYLLTTRGKPMQLLGKWSFCTKSLEACLRSYQTSMMKMFYENS